MLAGRYALSATDSQADIGHLTPNPLNPRGSIDPASLDDLVASVESQGILQPLLVTLDGLIVAGHRRYAAALRAGIEAVPVLVRDLSEREQLEIMLVENLQREDLTIVQEARTYRRLLDSGATTAALARAIGKPASHISSRLRLLELDDEVQERFHRGELSVVLIPVLLKVHEPFKQRRLATLAARRTITARELEVMVNRSLSTLNEARPPSNRPEPAMAPSGVSATRREILESIREHGEQVMTVAELVDVFESTCCSCGLESAPGMCTACPLMDLSMELLSVVRGG